MSIRRLPGSAAFSATSSRASKPMIDSPTAGMRPSHRAPSGSSAARYHPTSRSGRVTPRTTPKPVTFSRTASAFTRLALRSSLRWRPPPPWTAAPLHSSGTDRARHRKASVARKVFRPGARKAVGAPGSRSCRSTAGPRRWESGSAPRVTGATTPGRSAIRAGVDSSTAVVRRGADPGIGRRDVPHPVGSPRLHPDFRHPVTYSRSLLTLDDVSPGRLLAGLGSGTAHGYGHHRARPRFTERCTRGPLRRAVRRPRRAPAGTAEQSAPGAGAERLPLPHLSRGRAMDALGHPPFPALLGDLGAGEAEVARFAVLLGIRGEGSSAEFVRVLGAVRRHRPRPRACRPERSGRSTCPTSAHAAPCRPVVRGAVLPERSTRGSGRGVLRSRFRVCF